MTPRGLDAYRQTQVQSRTPLELVVLLYDGALTHIAVARDAIARRDIAARGAALSRVLAIVSELQSTLDLERGGEVAASLDGLYAYVSRRLMDAALHNDAAPLDEAARLLDTLRDGWRTIAQSPGAGPPAAARPAEDAS